VGLLGSLYEWLFRKAVSPIAELVGHPGAPVTARGRVVPCDLIDSPLAGERCVYYRYLVEEWRRATMNVGGAGLWHCAEHDEAMAEFYIADETGRALVEPGRARVEAFLEHSGAAGERRAREWLIRDGDLIEIRGAVADEIDDLLDLERGFRDPSTRVVLHAPEGGFLTIRVLGR